MQARLKRSYFNDTSWTQAFRSPRTHSWKQFRLLEHGSCWIWGYNARSERDSRFRDAFLHCCWWHSLAGWLPGAEKLKSNQFRYFINMVTLLWSHLKSWRNKCLLFYKILISVTIILIQESHAQNKILEFEYQTAWTATVRTESIKERRRGSRIPSFISNGTIYFFPYLVISYRYAVASKHFYFAWSWLFFMWSLAALTIRLQKWI
jgi:hypothetical protein